MHISSFSLKRAMIQPIFIIIRQSWELLVIIESMEFHESFIYSSTQRNVYHLTLLKLYVLRSLMLFYLPNLLKWFSLSPLELWFIGLYWPFSFWNSLLFPWKQIAWFGRYSLQIALFFLHLLLNLGVPSSSGIHSPLLSLCMSF